MGKRAKSETYGLCTVKLTKSQDHIAFSPAYAVDVITHSQLASPSFAAAQTADYIANRTGILTNCGGDVLGLW